ncbi:MAG: TPM domain-containing protein [Candidatus Aminicenantales bacterium]
MTIMSRRRLLKWLDADKIRGAIAAAEKKTSGEVRVSVAPFFWGRVRLVAERAFRRLGMTNTRERNGILFFIVPARKRFVVLGDEGIHAKVGQEFWDKIAEAMAERFRKGEFSDGLVCGIGAAAEGLAAHFPHDASTDINELPDDIDIAKT